MKLRKKEFCLLLLLISMFLSNFIKSFAIDSGAVEDVEGVNLNTWITGYSPMPTARNAFASARYNDKIYCIAGYNRSRLNKVEVYDITNDTWSEVTPIPTKRSNLIAEQYNGKIYCIGGFDNPTYYSTLEVYDIENDTWETKTPMPTARRSMASCLWNGKIYVGGGISANGYVDTLEVYDIATDTLPNMPTAREGLSAQVHNGNIYFIGGKDANYLNVMEVHDIYENKWRSSINMPTSRGYISSEIYAGNIYIVRGRNASTYMDKVEIYNINENKWSDGVNIPTKRDALVSEIFRGKIYAIGGNNGSFRNEVEAYYIYDFPEDKAYRAIQTANRTRLAEDIEFARHLVNNLSESSIKDVFQDLINTLSSSDTLSLQNATGNLDLYIKSSNMLSLSLDTNSVSFDNYSGVSDLEKTGAVNITVNSSLSYSLNTYLLTAITNSDNSYVIPSDVLNIKEGTMTDYQPYPNVLGKVLLKDNNAKGNNNTHSIDLKLSSNQAHKADIYKTVIKIEAEQK